MNPKYPLMGWDDDVPVHTAIQEAIGAASTCWEYPELAGVFDSSRAGAISEELIALLQAKLWTGSKR